MDMVYEEIRPLLDVKIKMFKTERQIMDELPQKGWKWMDSNESEDRKKSKKQLPVQNCILVREKHSMLWLPKISLPYISNSSGEKRIHL